MTWTTCPLAGATAAGTAAPEVVPLMKTSGCPCFTVCPTLASCSGSTSPETVTGTVTVFPCCAAAMSDVKLSPTITSTRYLAHRLKATTNPPFCAAPYRHGQHLCQNGCSGRPALASPLLYTGLPSP